MTYEGISFEIRTGLGRHEWTLLIAYPDRADHFVTQINGSRDDESCWPPSWLAE